SALHLRQRLVERAALLQGNLRFDQRRTAVLRETVDVHDCGDHGRDQRGLYDGEAEEDQPDDRTWAVQACPLALQALSAAYSTRCAWSAPRQKTGGGTLFPRRPAWP